MNRLPRRLGALLSMSVLTACSSSSTSPSPSAAPRSVSSEGETSSTAVTTDRIQLRTSAGAILSPGLVSDRTIDVPMNVDLDIWAEIRRLETDRARLVVDWGNGNADFTG